jgi:hypothetical protein
MSAQLVVGPRPGLRRPPSPGPPLRIQRRARRAALREALRDRGTGDDPLASAISRLSEVAALWLAGVDVSGLAWDTKQLYRITVKSHFMFGVRKLRLRLLTVPAVDRTLAAVNSSYGVAAASPPATSCPTLSAWPFATGSCSPPVREAAIRRGPRTSQEPGR